LNTYSILLVLSGLVVFSYLFELVSRRTRFPSVLLLLFSGIGLHYVADFFNWGFTGLFTVLPVLGSVGIILIVLEGTLDLKFERSKVGLILKALLISILTIVISSRLIAHLFEYVTKQPWDVCLANAVPFSIVSSAIAIPSVAKLVKAKKEFIIYESTFSDIMGVIAFNFVVSTKVITAVSFLPLLRDVVLIVLISILFCLLLLYLLRRINHHVKFFLVISILIFVYAAGELFHLSSLVIILAFGLFLNNCEKIKYKRFRDMFLYNTIGEDLKQMHQLSAESAFIVRTFFFLLFGFSVNLATIINLKVLVIGVLILAFIYFIRTILIGVVSPKNLFPEIFISPRGLISILLFFSLPESLRIPELESGLLFFVILASGLVMTFGLIYFKKDGAEEDDAKITLEKIFPPDGDVDRTV
jgi:Na+:H+ antiporter